MVRIYPNLYVGNSIDEENIRYQNNWKCVSACKEPYHRNALGYSDVSAPRNHPEYLFAYRGNSLILNLIDSDNPKYIIKSIIDEAISFVDKSLLDGHKVLIHCNEGKSRGPSIGLWYLVCKTNTLPKSSLQDAVKSFRELYPNYYPKAGMYGFLRLNWDKEIK